MKDNEKDSGTVRSTLFAGKRHSYLKGVKTPFLQVLGRAKCVFPPAAGNCVGFQGAYSTSALGPEFHLLNAERPG